MNLTDKVLNGIESKASTPEISVNSLVSGAASASKVPQISAQSIAAGLIITAKIMSIVAVAATVSLTADIKVVDPNDFVNSCFGAGYWLEELPWSETDAWVE